MMMSNSKRILMSQRRKERKTQLMGTFRGYRVRAYTRRMIT